MTNLADLFPYTGPVPAVGFPAYVGTTAPINPVIGSIWFNPTSGATQIFTATGWVASAAGGGGGPTTPTAPLALVDLTDVDAGAAIDGDILTYDNATGFWMAVQPDHDAGRY